MRCKIYKREEETSCLLKHSIFFPCWRRVGGWKKKKNLFFFLPSPLPPWMTFNIFLFPLFSLSLKNFFFFPFDASFSSSCCLLFLGFFCNFLLAAVGHQHRILGNFSNAQPPTVACKNGSSVGICTRCIHVFACFAPTCMLSQCLLTNFLGRSPLGSLLRLRCWLGMAHVFIYIYFSL